MEAQRAFESAARGQEKSADSKMFSAFSIGLAGYTPKRCADVSCSMKRVR
jgi:hypothetical protein